MTIHLPKDVESGRFASVDAAMTEAASLLLEQLRQVETDQPAASGAGQEHKPIWEEIPDLTTDVPSEEWEKLPTDLAKQHDRYIYGTPKRPVSKLFMP